MHKSDRELLKLAAKAAGYKVRQIYRDADMSIFYNNAGDTTFWNPLTDDGDALRLAVKLNLLHGKVFARGVANHHRDGGDIYAATRRAIVRAAAAIGETLP